MVPGHDDGDGDQCDDGDGDQDDDEVHDENAASLTEVLSQGPYSVLGPTLVRGVWVYMAGRVIVVWWAKYAVGAESQGFQICLSPDSFSSCSSKSCSAAPTASDCGVPASVSQSVPASDCDVSEASI